MKFLQMTKRLALFLIVNLLVMLTITLLLSLFGVNRYFPQGGYGSLMIFCFIWGMGGAFISLGLSRIMAKWMMGVQVIPPDTNQPALRELVETVHDLARRAGLSKMPEVGLFESQEVNAFATGPSRSRSLVAVSTGLLNTMRPNEVAGVLGHEIAHIANGDMVTMTLIQGVINAFVMFLARVLAFAVTQAMRSRDERDSGGGGWMQWILVQLFQMVFSLLGFMVVAWFSRQREFRADAGGAAYAGKENMVGALRALQRHFDPQLNAAEAQHASGFQAMKISGKQGGFMALMSTHPPLEVRIERLQQSVR